MYRILKHLGKVIKGWQRQIQKWGEQYIQISNSQVICREWTRGKPLLWLLYIVTFTLCSYKQPGQVPTGHNSKVPLSLVGIVFDSLHMDADIYIIYLWAFESFLSNWKDLNKVVLICVTNHILYGSNWKNVLLTFYYIRHAIFLFVFHLE